MVSIRVLEDLSSQLATAVRTYSKHCRDDSTDPSKRAAFAATEWTSQDAENARKDVFNLCSRIQAHVSGPGDLIHELARQSQLLACLKWLGSFQILACVPLADRISVREVAEISGVTEPQLKRVIRMTATAGFLYEPTPGQVAHTALSSSFVKNLDYLDAAVFLAETAAPAALHMTDVAQADLAALGSTTTTPSAYGIAFNATDSFHAACAKSPQLQRGWTAYRRCTGGDVHDNLVDMLGKLNWNALRPTWIVDVDAPSTATAVSLAKLHPNLHVKVQMTEPPTSEWEDCNGRVVVERRSRAGSQDASDAAVYIVRLPAILSSQPPHHPGNGHDDALGTCSGSSSSGSSSGILAELHAHMVHLRADPLAILILAPLRLPEPTGGVEPAVAALARESDLTRQQLLGERSLEVDEVIEMLESVRDADGGLVVVRKIYSRADDATLALGVKYQLNAAGAGAAASAAAAAAPSVGMRARDRPETERCGMTSRLEAATGFLG